MRVVRISPEAWAPFSERAHLICFNEAKPASLDRISFALVVEDENEMPMLYGACKEHDAESLYYQYGGAFPGTKGTIKSFRCFEAILAWAVDNGYRRVSFLVENTNEPMLKLAMRSGFLITGVRYFKGNVLLEHVKEFASA